MEEIKKKRKAKKDLNGWIFLCLEQGGYKQCHAPLKGFGFWHKETNDVITLVEIMDFSHQGITVTVKPSFLKDINEKLAIVRKELKNWG